MIPSFQVYKLLFLGMAIALPLALLWPFGSRLGAVSLFLLIFDGIVLGLTLWDSHQVDRQRVQILREPIHRLSIGRDNPVVLEVSNGDQATTIQIRDAYPQEFIASSQQLQIVLPPQSRQVLTYSVQPRKRGKYTWGDLQVRQLGPGGLAWKQWTISQTETVTVYPDLVGLRSLSLRLALQSSGAIRQKRRQGMGTEFSELREYNPGDDPRLVDWKATARRNRLLVRVLEPEQEQTLIILLDRGRLMTAQVQGLTRFDWGLNATLALAMAGLQRGDRVGVGVFDRQIHTWIPPERGQNHLTYLLERLSPLQPEFLEPDYLGTVTTLIQQQSRRALVVILTDLVDTTASAELLLALGRLAPRYLPFCVTLRDPQVDHQAHTWSGEAAAAYSRAVALDLLAQRQLAFAKLKQKGVLVLDAPAGQISNQLVDQYLRLKLRNQL